jgi:hypothetical protein
LTYKFGYGSDQEKFKQEAHKFSLLNDGTLAKPCTKLFLVNVSVNDFLFFRPPVTNWGHRVTTTRFTQLTTCMSVLKTDRPSSHGKSIEEPCCGRSNGALPRFVKGKKHMGEPESFTIILNWIYAILGLEGNVVDQLKTLPFKAKY